MGLYVSTTGTDVDIPELGISITHPTIDRDLTYQFNPEDIRNAENLTSAITSGLLSWKKTSLGSTESPSSYDPDFVDVENENTGSGYRGDRVVTFKDMKSGVVQHTDFADTPKTANVVFSQPFTDNNYSITISGSDNRSWSFQNRTSLGFTINANANQPLTGPVSWSAEYISN